MATQKNIWYKFLAFILILIQLQSYYSKEYCTKDSGMIITEGNSGDTGYYSGDVDDDFNIIACGQNYYNSKTQAIINFWDNSYTFKWTKQVYLNDQTTRFDDCSLQPTGDELVAAGVYYSSSDAQDPYPYVMFINKADGQIMYSYYIQINSDTPKSLYVAYDDNKLGIISFLGKNDNNLAIIIFKNYEITDMIKYTTYFNELKDMDWDKQNAYFSIQTYITIVPTIIVIEKDTVFPIHYLYSNENYFDDQNILKEDDQNYMGIIGSSRILFYEFDSDEQNIKASWNFGDPYFSKTYDLKVISSSSIMWVQSDLEAFRICTIAFDEDTASGSCIRVTGSNTYVDPYKFIYVDDERKYLIGEYKYLQASSSQFKGFVFYQPDIINDSNCFTTEQETLTFTEEDKNKYYFKTDEYELIEQYRTTIEQIFDIISSDQEIQTSFYGNITSTRCFSTIYEKDDLLSANDESYTYYIEAETIIDIYKFTPDCNEATYSNNNSLDFVSIDSSDYQLTIYSTDTSLGDETYYIKFTAYYECLDYEMSYILTLFIRSTTPFNTAPFFIEALQDQTVTKSSITYYSLPEIYDYQGDDYDITTSQYQSSALPNFVSYSNYEYLIKPTKSTAIQTYKIKITITDDNDNSKSTSLYFNIIVQENDQSDNQNSKNNSSSNATESQDGTLIEEDFFTNSIDKNNTSQQNAENPAAKIVRISNQGLVQVKFTQQM